jgi:Zn finger protein HypA/HybF involved in hydrogenase expression
MFNTQKVVKCGSCNSYFGHSQKSTKCPFCHTEHDGKVEDKNKVKKVQVKTSKCGVLTS